MVLRIFDVWKYRVEQLKIETYTIYLAYKDSTVPWYAKVLVACVVGYLFCLIHKFLDPFPIIRYLNHLILIPMGFVLAFRKMVPPAVLDDCREKARIIANRKKPTNWVDGFIIIFIWFLFGSFAIVLIAMVMKDWEAVLIWWFGWFMKMTKLRGYMAVHGGA